MFNMPANSGDNGSYQLRITYKSQTNQYYVTGLIGIERENGFVDYERDGGVRVFDTMEQAIGYIVNHGETDIFG